MAYYSMQLILWNLEHHIYNVKLHKFFRHGCVDRFNVNSDSSDTVNKIKGLKWLGLDLSMVLPFLFFPGGDLPPWKKCVRPCLWAHACLTGSIGVDQIVISNIGINPGDSESWPPRSWTGGLKMCNSSNVQTAKPARICQFCHTIEIKYLFRILLLLFSDVNCLCRRRKWSQ